VVRPNGTGWDRLEYLGQVGLGQGDLQIRWDRMGMGQGGFRLGGTGTRGVFQLNQSTCPKVGLVLKRSGNLIDVKLEFESLNSIFRNLYFEQCRGSGLFRRPHAQTTSGATKKVRCMIHILICSGLILMMLLVYF